MRARRKPKKLSVEAPTVAESPKLRIVVAETTGDYRHLGVWVAQIKGLPQARTYGKDKVEAVGKLILTLGKENGIVFLPASELDPQRRERL